MQQNNKIDLSFLDNKQDKSHKDNIVAESHKAESNKQRKNQKVITLNDNKFFKIIKILLIVGIVIVLLFAICGIAMAIYESIISKTQGDLFFYVLIIGAIIAFLARKEIIQFFGRFIEYEDD